MKNKGLRKIYGMIAKLKKDGYRNASSNHLTLNPSPEGEGLYSIAERDGFLRTLKYFSEAYRP